MEQEQSSNRVEVQRNNVLNESIVRFMGGTDAVVKNLVLRLTDSKVVNKKVTVDGKDMFVKEYEAGTNRLVNEVGLSRIMFFIEGVNNEATKLSNSPSIEDCNSAILRLMDGFASDMSINYKTWGINKADVNLLYDTIHHFTRMCVLDSLKGFKTDRIAKESSSKEIIGGVPALPQLPAKNKGGMIK